MADDGVVDQVCLKGEVLKSSFGWFGLIGLVVGGSGDWNGCVLPNAGLASDDMRIISEISSCRGKQKLLVYSELENNESNEFSVVHPTLWLIQLEPDCKTSCTESKPVKLNKLDNRYVGGL
jgi:hypothetical protein